MYRSDTKGPILFSLFLDADDEKRISNSLATFLRNSVSSSSSSSKTFSSASSSREREREKERESARTKKNATSPRLRDVSFFTGERIQRQERKMMMMMMMMREQRHRR